MLLNEQKNLNLFMVLMSIAVGLVCAPSAIGATLNVPADYSTIQDAIDAAQNGDTVQVAPGTYYENIKMKNGVDLLGAGADVTTIDGQGIYSVVDARANDVTISGFTIMNSGVAGGANYWSGVYINGNYSPSVMNNIIVDNAFGIGVYYGANPDIGNNIIKNNFDGLYVYGTDESPSNPSITNNTIMNNERGGITLRVKVSPIILNNIITGHVDGWWSEGTFYPNSWGIHYNYVTGSPVLNYNDLWNNDVDYMRDNAADDTLAGTGAISDDPMFVNAAGGDYHLKASSPCIDAGNNVAPSLPLTDLDGNPRVVDGDSDGEAIVDMGAYEAIVGSTPSGEDVVVQPEDPVTGETPITLIFDDVTEGGVTTVTSTTPSDQQGAPEGFKFGNPPVIYEITTTADYTGNITICFDYSGASYGNEANLKLSHRTDVGWVDITNPDDPPDNPNPDTINKIICGTVTSLSFFCVFEPEFVDPVELLEKLAGKIFVLNLQHGISNSLDAKLDAALKALEDINENNDVAAINTLEAFINAVEAQRGNKIPEADADELISTAQEIIAILSG